MSDEQVPLNRTDLVDGDKEEGVTRILPDLSYQRLAIVNVAFFGASTAVRDWVLIDAGVPGSAGAIQTAADFQFGQNAHPRGIVLTHGHFDHVGALAELADLWNVPIYAHALELPYLDGRSAYPPPDPTVGGGMMAALSRFYPRGPINVRRWLEPLPADGTIPVMPGWAWVHTPGHTPGHVSLWREEDRTLIAGDAFITTRQESAYAVATQKPEMHGPPMYYTQDWRAARLSVEKLAALEPELVLTGHGKPAQGDGMRSALRKLAQGFDEIAVPDEGRYVDTPARANESGVTFVPSK